MQFTLVLSPRIHNRVGIHRPDTPEILWESVACNIVVQLMNPILNKNVGGDRQIRIHLDPQPVLEIAEHTVFQRDLDAIPVILVVR